MKGSSLSHPALFTRISSGPSSRSTVSTAAIALSRLVTSSRTARASPPAALISSAVFAATASWISAIATLAPSSARRVAIARPIPCAAPVTIATLPLRRLIPDAILCVTTSCPRSNRIRSWQSQPFSYRGPSAVDDKRRAGGERRVVTGEEQRHLRDLLGLADAVETRDSLHRGAGSLAAAHPPHHGRVDRARADCVDADVVAAVFERGDATIASASALFETSDLTANALPPSASIMRAVSCAPFSSISAQAMRAPSLAKRSEAARPIPEPAPVISAILLASFIYPPIMCVFLPNDQP